MFNFIYDLFYFLFDASSYISIAIVLFIISFNMAVNAKW